jgi:UDP-glucose 4-epimerase
MKKTAKNEFKDKRILVTGGGGFIGSAMVRSLVKQGLNVRAFDLPEQISRNPPPKDAEIYKGSVLDTNDVTNAMHGCDYVIHLAAMLGVKRTEMKRLDTLNVNILGTINILEGCVKEKIKKILFASSSEVYGDQMKIPISEENPLYPKSVYAVTKLAGEEYMRAYKKRYGLEYSIVRFFNVYGPGQVAEFVMPRFIECALDNKPQPPKIYDKGDQIRSFCYVDDIVKGAFLVLINKKANSEIFNLGNDKEPISIRDLAYKVISLAQKDLEPEYVAIDNSDRSAEREILRRIPDISKAKRVLGYEPEISLSAGILKVMEYGNIEESWFDPMER